MRAGKIAAVVVGALAMGLGILFKDLKSVTAGEGVLTQRAMNQTLHAGTEPFPAGVAELATERKRMPRETQCLGAYALT